MLSRGWLAVKPVVEIREIDSFKLKSPVIIEGFPGIGMLGTISASYLAEKLEMKLVGYFASSHFPPIAAIHNFKPVSPARIYASEKHNLLVLFSEFVIPANIVFSLSQTILEYAKKNKACMIYSLAGVASPAPDAKIYGIASTPQIGEKLKKAGVELISEGATQGVSGVLIAECASEKFPAANLMAQTSQPLDPRSAARLLDKLSEVVGMKFETKDLVLQAEKVEDRIRDAMDKMKAMHQSYSQMQENPMYG